MGIKSIVINVQVLKTLVLAVIFIDLGLSTEIFQNELCRLRQQVAVDQPIAYTAENEPNSSTDELEQKGAGRRVELSMLTCLIKAAAGAILIVCT